MSNQDMPYEAIGDHSSKNGKGFLAAFCCPKNLGPAKACPGYLQIGPCMKGTNYNVVLVNMLVIMFGLAESIWTGTALAAFLYTLSQDSNTRVGIVEAAQGISGLVFALPVGYLADRWSRSKVIALGGVLSIVAAAFTGYAVYKGAEDEDKWRTHYNILLGTMCIWGITGGIVNGPTQALYADSTPQGTRSKYYQYLFIGWGLSSIAGPLVSILLFAVYGNEWTLQRLRTVILAGMAGELITGVMMFFFRDDAALDENDDDEEEEEEGEGEEQDSKVEKAGGVLDDGGSHNTAASSLRNGEGKAAEQQQQKLQDGGDKDGDEQELGGHASPHPGGRSSRRGKSKRRGRGEKQTVTERFLNEGSYCGGRWTRHHVPYVLFASDLVSALGSGMTVKYFPLFFKNDVDMSPIEVQIIYVACPIAMVLFSSIGTSIKDYIGRVQTIILFRLIGVALLITMSILASGITTSKYILVPIYIVRTGVMNCTYPLDESILMDFCRKEQRARWKSLESISAFGWCGSAVLGGILGDAHGYSFTFLITAMIQGSSILLTASLLPLVPVDEKARSESISTASYNEEEGLWDGKSDVRALLDPCEGDRGVGGSIQ